MLRFSVLFVAILLFAAGCSALAPVIDVSTEGEVAVAEPVSPTVDETDLAVVVPSSVPAVDTSLHSVPLDQVVFDTFRRVDRELPLTDATPEQILQLRDAIPPLHQPAYESADEAQWLEGSDVVLGYSVGDSAWAFPVKILNYHEIVNDVFAGEPILISYCPLCYSGIVFRRTLDDRVLTFGNTSALYESDMVMLDYGTGSYWWQVAGEAIVGTLTGQRLELLPSMMTTWDEWRANHPDTLVLSRSTGFSRDYTNDPFLGIGSMYDGGRFAFSVSDATEDARLSPGTKVLAVQVGDSTRAYPLVSEGLTVIHDLIDNHPIVVLTGPSGSAVYNRTVEGTALEFSISGGEIVDNRSGSRWNLAGEATDGPHAGEKLTPVPSKVTFWFALVAAEPGISIWDGS